MSFFPAPASVELVLGGARSGKSSYALACALRHDRDVCWIATAQAWDEEMASRIRRHQSERPAHWHTIEAPLALAEAIRTAAVTSSLIVVDCLTLWLSNCLLDNDKLCLAREQDALAEVLASHAGRLLLVSNEVGSGIVPDNALARQFRDAAGHLHQRLAQLVPDVTILQAGLPFPLKRAGQACWQ
ncbi:bifunctional adenosylcobinamide kinase/adenosylcobinamide-phosphate guanylyltransferase [Chitinilyticum piscinae]|uniref:Bifunctional adenosylcobalamin biosynthesis protein n=1 Tax=Chitinilyticum piscinae TaxID=2866724 RepID=A0A8J7FMC4_9NEIS|nr:bifunctional adenosylcobinamide kinase/adenosylcobinamide-phosphate guanylyltransferase [Chitinilyticum piscinae]MBE9608864.1 bifunctional adenosylcobinamide kinase/adenosylcobinamide-phosphate guanylyltransferase [Chitinilyticum piscinae]